MKYRLVIFDFDGTLANSFPWLISVGNTLAETYRFKRIEPHEVDRLRGASARQIVQHLGIPWWKMPLIARATRQLAAQHVDQIPLFDGVDLVLQALSEAGVTMGLVSSNAYANVQRVLGPTNAARITYYECSVSMFGKQARFRRMLKQAGVPPQEALCIGDELRDLEAANKAQIPFGAVAWGFTKVEALQALGPAEVFLQMQDIRDRIVGRSPYTGEEAPPPSTDNV